MSDIRFSEFFLNSKKEKDQLVDELFESKQKTLEENIDPKTMEKNASNLLKKIEKELDDFMDMAINIEYKNENAKNYIQDSAREVASIFIDVIGRIKDFSNAVKKHAKKELV